MKVNLASTPMQMFRGQCQACNWQWDVVVLPMPVTEAARVISDTSCPMCGNRHGNSVGDPRPLTEAEKSHKLTVLQEAP